MVLLLLALVGLGLRISAQVFKGYRENRLQERRDRCQADLEVEERRRECDYVVRFFANSSGYVAREAVSRAELTKLIDAGITPAQLMGVLADRTRAVEGLRLGRHDQTLASLPVQLPDEFQPRGIYVIGKNGSGKTSSCWRCAPVRASRTHRGPPRHRRRSQATSCARRWPVWA